MGEIPDGAIDVSQDGCGGVMKVIKTPGQNNETPQTGDTVKVHYVGTLYGGDDDGKKFDSSRDRGDPFSFKLGEGQVIKGWDQGVATMKQGEICDLICKPDFAYGENGSPPTIPPNATLKFEVELLSWAGEDLFDDGGVIRSVIEKGDGYTNPTEGAKVTVHLKGQHGDKVFDERDVNFDLGDGISESVCPGVEKAIQKMKKGEKSRLAIKGAKYLPSEAVLRQHGIADSDSITYDVHLKNFEKLKENWELDTNEKINQAELMKTHGTTFFKSGKFHMAIIYYKKCVSYVEYNADFDDEEKKQKGQQLLQAGRLNLALCYLKQNDFSHTIEECGKVIERDSKSDKAFFRRGQAYLSQNEYELAVADFKKVRELDSSNKAAHNQLLICQQKIKEQLNKEKKTFYGMFDKFAKIDAKKVPKDDTTEDGDDIQKTDNSEKESANAESAPAAPMETSDS